MSEVFFGDFVEKLKWRNSGTPMPLFGSQGYEAYIFEFFLQFRNFYGSHLMVILTASIRGSYKSVDYADGTLLDQTYRLHNVIWSGFGKLESRLSQPLSKKVKNCHKEGPYSRQ